MRGKKGLNCAATISLKVRGRVKELSGFFWPFILGGGGGATVGFGGGLLILAGGEGLWEKTSRPWLSSRLNKEEFFLLYLIF